MVRLGRAAGAPRRLAGTPSGRGRYRDGVEVDEWDRRWTTVLDEMSPPLRAYLTRVLELPGEERSQAIAELYQAGRSDSAPRDDLSG
jgi:hypothetical protein